MSKLVTNKLNKTKLGAVPTPTQDQIERWRNPKQYEEEQTMKDTFENLGVKNA